MSSVNKVILIGNVGKDPEVKQLTNGKVANMVLATSEKYKDKNGDRQENTEWHNIVIYGNLLTSLRSMSIKETSCTLKEVLPHASGKTKKGTTDTIPK
jgi:single-strand DNA-binding protein